MKSALLLGRDADHAVDQDSKKKRKIKTLSDSSMLKMSGKMKMRMSPIAHMEVGANMNIFKSQVMDLNQDRISSQISNSNKNNQGRIKAADPR